MTASRVLVGVGAVAATAAGVFSLTRPVTLVSPSDQPTAVAVAATTLGCPGLPAAAQSQTSVQAVAPATGSAPTGQARETPGDTTLGLAPLGRPVPAPAETARPGVPLEQTFSTGTAPVTLVRGTGDTAPGLAAAQWTTARSSVSTALPGASGLAATRCSAASDDWWFQGVTTTIGTVSRLVLVNPAPSTAVVDLSFFGPDGAVEGVGARDVAVAADARIILDLARYAPGLVDGTVSVVATAGRVVAAIHLDEQEGLAPLGSEWLAPTVAPSSQLLVNATHGDADRRRLLVTNPGDREALVQVRLLGTSGPFVSTDLETIRVRPGHVVTEDVTDVFGDSAAAVQLISTSPITGGIVDEFEPTGSRPADLSSGGASPSLTEPGVVPMIPGSRLSLVLTSTTRAGGAVVVDLRDDEGRTTSTERLNVRGVSNRIWPAVDPQATYVVVTSEPGAGIHASALYSGPDGVTALAVLSGSYTALRPSVSPVL